MQEETISIQTEWIALGALLKYANVAESGAAAKEIIRDGCVAFNGQTCTERGKKVRPGDVVTLPGVRLLVK